MSDSCIYISANAENDTKREVVKPNEEVEEVVTVVKSQHLK